MEKYKPNYELNPKIISLIENISRMQGQLQGYIAGIKDELNIHFYANVDAVHYSTKIEGNKLTLKQVTNILSGTARSKTTKLHHDLKEILNYSKARSYLAGESTKNKKLNLDLILKTHKILLNNIVSGKLKGHLREAQNVITESNSRKIIYLPPEPRDVLPFLHSLISFINNALLDGISPLICAAIFHYRFATIHPFMDGNGRLARLFSSYILQSNNYTVSQYAAIEKQHEENRVMYYSSLRKIQGNNYYDIPTSINITSFMEYYLLCLNNTYIEALTRIQKIKSDNFEILELDDRLNKAISLFKKHYKLSASDYQSLVGLRRTQAVADLNELVKNNIIKIVGGGRSTVYVLNQIENEKK